MLKPGWLQAASRKLEIILIVSSLFSDWKWSHLQSVLTPCLHQREEVFSIIVQYSETSD